MKTTENTNELKNILERVRYKRVVEWDEDAIRLEDGTLVTLECTESDCCAGAYGEFKPKMEKPPLDAMITDIVISDMVDVYHPDTIVKRVTLKIFHNQNIICEAEMTADAGNGGYYYSVGSLVVDEIIHPIVDA